MGIETALIVGALAATGAGIASTVQARKAAKKAQGVNVAPIDTPKVEGGKDLTKGDGKEDETARRIGRQALIATSPQGVLTTAPTGRRKLLGN